MSKIFLKINNEVEFTIDIYTDTISQLFFNQLLSMFRNEPQKIDRQSFIMDNTKYTLGYFEQLIQRAKDIQSIDWSEYKLNRDSAGHSENQKMFNRMHKDLEHGNASGTLYQGLSQEQIDIINELHCVLHTLEDPNLELEYSFKGRSWVNFNFSVGYTRTPMPEPVKFRRRIDPGEICLDYPYVGREPFTCMQTGDNSDLALTCKMIDCIANSYRMYLGDKDMNPGYRWAPDPWPDDVDQSLAEWYHQHREVLDSLGYNLEKIINHTGFCVVGKVSDLDALAYLKSTEFIERTEYRLIEE